MRVIHGKIGSGKTTRLIQNVKEFGGVLVVASIDHKKHLIRSEILAKDQVVTFREKRNCGGDGRRYWIDNIEDLLIGLFGPGCDGFSMDTPTSITEMKFNR